MPVQRVATHAARAGSRHLLQTANQVVKAVWPIILPILQKKFEDWLTAQLEAKAKPKSSGSKKAPAKKPIKKAPPKRPVRKAPLKKK
jgi:hypothetical protein